MSRCFPFPPPGYEKKARTDDLDLLTKEKQKEKKHKKDKKEKKKDSKERKDKERSKDKQRDKKEGKEKRKEKKKDKNREKKDKAKVPDENKNEGQLQSYNGGKLNENMQNAVGIKDSKFVEEFGRKIGDEGGGTRNHMVENFAGCDHRKAEGMGRVVEKDIDSRVQGKENKDRKRDVEKTDNKRNRDEERGMGNAMVQNFTGLDQRRIGGIAKQVEKDVEKRVEGKEKNKELVRDNKQGNGHKERGREKKSKGEGKSKEKGKTTEKIDSVKKHDIIREGSRDLKTTPNAKPLLATKDSDKNSVTEGNLKKRKEYEANGFLHGDDVRPNKLPRPTFSHPFTENGRKLEPCQTPIQQASGMHGEANNLLTEKKEHKVNGLIDAQPSAIRSLSSSATTAKSSENGVTITKPPHPDSKYLNQILSVPKMGEWSEFDDQEWLFSIDNHEPKKHKLVSSWVDETRQVWDKALQIEYDDVCALPYVIPY